MQIELLFVLNGNCIGFYIFLFIKFFDRYWSIFPGNKELVLLVELYERYGHYHF